MKLKEMIQICPRCNSPNIETDFSNAAAISSGFMGAKKCNNCGYAGHFFPEISISKLKKLKIKRIKDKKFLPDKTYISGVIGLWRATGIIIVIAAIIFMTTLDLLGGFILLTIGVLASVYSFLYKNQKERFFMKVLIILLALASVLFYVLWIWRLIQK